MLKTILFHGLLASIFTVNKLAVSLILCFSLVVLRAFLCDVLQLLYYLSKYAILSFSFLIFKNMRYRLHPVESKNLKHRSR